ncbi:putative DNA-binding domain-containing protein [Bacterioplanoides sp.]|uniref:HvfC/BufC family peptide modification chaperone n=1 Tax=Bacterioplanoides sp. TaxID=2066072 RepID=UPI003B00F2B7
MAELECNAPELKKLQQDFMQYLLNPNQQTGEQFHGWVSEQRGLPAPSRMQIYANGYLLRLRETIDTDHEILGLYLGDDLFEQMVEGYVRQNPSTFRSLRQFADALPDYLANDAFFSQHPLLSELAAFERRLIAAFDAADSEPVGFAELQALSPDVWPGIQFRFHSSLQLFSCYTNAVESWQALKAEQAPSQPESGDIRHWLIWRGKERLTEFVSLQPYQHALISGFLEGNNFAQQCELMLNWFDENEAAVQVLQALQAWFEMGIIRSIIVND